VTLPFVSYGGSSLLTAFISLLLLILVSNRGEEDPAPLPYPFPYLLISGGLLAALLALALMAGWWAVVRSDQIVTRTDNPRRAIADRYVRRGTLLDRNNLPISRTDGQPGDYQRIYEYPPLSPITGYNNPLYGQAGLESGLDTYLRGLNGNPDTMIWMDHLLYGQPPPGVDVRLTLDLALQKQADQLLEGHPGALVLLNAATGEILASASHPYFNPNQLEDKWDELVQDPSAPLLNRATQGQYPPGASLGPFLLAYARSLGQLPEESELLSYPTPAGSWTCAQEPARPFTLAKMVANGCPAPLLALSKSMATDQITRLFDSLGFYESPRLPLEMSAPSDRGVGQADLAAIGEGHLTVTPLQMALAAAALTHQGIRPEPQLATAVLTPDRGWVTLTKNAAKETLLSGNTEPVINLLADTQAQHWQAISLARTPESELTWLIAGTLPQSQGTPLALALVLEENNPELAEQISRSLLQSQ
jgi:cell division protein FtsI/penicillin-binding protein 2